jgi:type IV secretory pathway VirB10-like protein
MKIHEVLIESQLNEEMLTELDWSKIKKGLAAGIISLGALGISSGALAGDKDGSYEKQLTPAQAMQIIKQKLQQGDIKPAVVKQAVQKVDAAPEIKKAEPKVDVKPEVKKAEEPKKSSWEKGRAGDQLDDKAPTKETSKKISTDGKMKMVVQHGDGVWIDLTGIGIFDGDSMGRIKYPDGTIVKFVGVVNQKTFKTMQVGSAQEWDGNPGASTKAIAEKLLKVDGPIKIEVDIYGKGSMIFTFN